MGGQELDLERTGIVIPPRGRALLCVWGAVPGAVAAPFFFWRGVLGGAVFCLVWAALVWCVWVRACSFAAALGEKCLEVYSGVAFPVRRAVPRAAVTKTAILRTPLARAAGVSVLYVSAPGACVVLPAIPAHEAEALAAALAGGGA